MPKPVCVAAAPRAAPGSLRDAVDVAFGDLCADRAAVFCRPSAVRQLTASTPSSALGSLAQSAIPFDARSFSDPIVTLISTTSRQKLRKHGAPKACITAAFTNKSLVPTLFTASFTSSKKAAQRRKANASWAQLAHEFLDGKSFRASAGANQPSGWFLPCESPHWKIEIGVRKRLVREREMPPFPRIGPEAAAAHSSGEHSAVFLRLRADARRARP